MTKVIDPEGVEIKVAKKLVSFDSKDVLEVGCGEGRLTSKYFSGARKVVAVDPVESSIRIARENLPARTAPNVEFSVGRGDLLQQYADESFDTVFFTLSLCCIDIPVMGRSLDEAWRLLRPGGALLNLQPSLHQPFTNGFLTYLIKKKFGTTVDDERYRQARFALKYKALIERKFEFVSEEQFEINTQFETMDEVIDDLTRDARDQYQALTDQTKAIIRKEIQSNFYRDGLIFTKENLLLTFLRKGKQNGLGSADISRPACCPESK